MTEKHLTGPLPTDEWDPSLQPVLDDTKGRPLNVHGLMAHQPALLGAWWDLRNYTIAGGDLGQRQTELLILRVALLLGNWYEWASHVQRGLATGLTMAEIERVKAGPDDPAWQPDERVLIRAIDELVQDRAITDATLAALREHFSDRQILDAIVTQGAYITLGCLLNTFETPLDEHILADLPAEVTRDSFEQG